LGIGERPACRMIAQSLAQHSRPSNYHLHSLVENYSRHVLAYCLHPVVKVIIMVMPIHIIVISINEIFIRLITIWTEVVNIKGCRVNHVSITIPISTVLTSLSAMHTHIFRAIIALVDVIMTSRFSTAITRGGIRGGAIIKTLASLFRRLLAMAEPTLPLFMERAIMPVMTFALSTLIAFRHVPSPRTLVEQYTVHEGAPTTGKEPRCRGFGSTDPGPEGPGELGIGER